MRKKITMKISKLVLLIVVGCFFGGCATNASKEKKEDSIFDNLTTQRKPLVNVEEEPESKLNGTLLSGSSLFYTSSDIIPVPDNGKPPTTCAKQPEIDKITALKNKLKRAKKQLKRARKQLKSLKSEKSDLESQRVKQQKEIDKITALENELKRARKQLESLKSEKSDSDLESQIKDARSKLEEIIEKNKTVLKEYKQYDVLKNIVSKGELAEAIQKIFESHPEVLACDRKGCTAD